MATYIFYCIAQIHKSETLLNCPFLLFAHFPQFSTFVINAQYSYFKRNTCVFHSSMCADVVEGFRHTYLYVISVLRCSKLLSVKLYAVYAKY